MKHLNPLNPVEICSWNEKKKHKKKLNRGVSDVASGVLCITPVPIIISGSRRRIVHISHYDQVRSHVAVPTDKFLRKLRLSDFAADMGRSHQSEVISDESDLSVPNEQKFHLMVHLFDNL